MALYKILSTDGDVISAVVLTNPLISITFLGFFAV